jgi:hypothetical protein
MNLRPVRVYLDKLLSRHRRDGFMALEKTLPAKQEISIWAMELPNEAYTAPRSAFWFISTGTSR